MSFRPWKGREWTKWEDIRSSNKTEFRMLYRYTMMMMRHLEHKLEQMAARYKELDEETPGDGPPER
ncbi:MAG: hypothetical protein LBO78_03155 [Rickettsiales bacterium]|jgi:hypothetical protein|nr:hypothetical protein [Rickettsiales bacterium]